MAAPVEPPAPPAQIPVQQVHGGYDFVDEDEMQERFIDEINIWDFYADSSTVYMNTVRGKRKMTHTICRKHLGGTYFDKLPLELIELIFEWERQARDLKRIQVLQRDLLFGRRCRDRDGTTFASYAQTALPRRNNW